MLFAGNPSEADFIKGFTPAFPLSKGASLLIGVGVGGVRSSSNNVIIPGGVNANIPL